jgi:ribosome-binding protein aMBF1 (putative translation factor)
MDFLTDDQIKEEIDKFGTVKDLAVELNLNRSMLNRMKSGTLKINNVYRTLFTLYFNVNVSSD